MFFQTPKSSQVANQHLINTKGQPRSPPHFHLASDLPSQWNGDCGLVKSLRTICVLLLAPQLVLLKLSRNPSWTCSVWFPVRHASSEPHCGSYQLLNLAQDDLSAWRDCFELECKKRRNSIWPMKQLFTDNWRKSSQVNDRSVLNGGLPESQEWGYLMIHLVSKYNSTGSQVSHRWKMCISVSRSSWSLWFINYQWRAVCYISTKQATYCIPFFIFYRDPL